MEIIQRLPFVLSVFMAIVIGVTSSIYSKSQHEIYTGMIVGMLVFFILGIFIRGAVISIIEDLDKKKEIKKLEEQELLNSNPNGRVYNKNDPSSVSSQLDLRIDEDTEKFLYDEDFSPLKVSEIIKTRE